MHWLDTRLSYRKKPDIPVFTLFFIVVLLFATLPSPAMADSAVHGRVYDWSTFKAIDVAVVQVNTTPAQKVVTTDGSYAFSLPGGEYTITAEARSASGPLSARENITVPDSGDFVIDLLLFPADDLTILKNLNQSLPVTVEESPSSPGAQGWILPALAISAAALLLAAGGAYLLIKKREPAPGVQGADAAIPEPAPSPVSIDATGRVLRQDCKDVLSAIAKNGGRMTQLELRKALPYSEVKISLIASELEDAGLLRKVKKGRGNILILTQTGPDKEKADEKLK
jgi:uncharacterized membrane protein